MARRKSTHCRYCATELTSNNSRKGACMLCNTRVQAEYYYGIKKIVYQQYGAQCNCCGEIIEEFLTIDHVNNDGNIERKKYKTITLMLKIIAENFPDTYQILCWNCNCAKGKLGYCPHERKTDV